MTREELEAIINDERSSELTKVVAESALKDLKIDAMEKDNADLRHNLEDWKCENKALKERIKELEDELQVANRCAEDARERIKELE